LGCIALFLPARKGELYLGAIKLEKDLAPKNKPPSLLGGRGIKGDEVYKPISWLQI
jgi:hypothetical protein